MCVGSPFEPELLAELSTVFDRPRHEVQGEFCGRLASNIASGKITTDQLAGAMQEDPKALIELTLALLDPAAPVASNAATSSGPTVKAVSAMAADETTAHAFFNEIVQLADQHDPRLAERYADDARVLISMRRSDGGMAQSELVGLQVKESVRRLAPLAARQGSRSTYENVMITVEGKHARIAAIRHDIVSCHRDPDWSAMIAVQADRTYRIVEERVAVGSGDGCLRT